MKKNLLLIGSTLAALGGLTNANGAETSLTQQADVVIRGVIQAPTCIINRSRTSGTVDLPLVFPEHVTGKEYSQQSAELKLAFDGCQTTQGTGNKVIVSLEGQKAGASGTDSTILKNDLEASDQGAKGVGVRINKSEKDQFVLGSKDEKTFQPTEPKEMVYTAHYQKLATTDVIAGQVSATANFNVQYE